MNFKQNAFVLACSVLAVAPASAQQSTLTLYGVLDGAVSRLQAAGAGYRIGLSDGNQAASRLGVRGIENLGGGMSASFMLEGGLTPDDGNSAGYSFQRRSTVSLSGPLGEIRMGRDFAPSYFNVPSFDPFGARGIGTSMAATNFGYSDLRNSNQISYFTPNRLDGWFGQASYSWGGSGGVEPSSIAPNSKQGNYVGARGGYESGPLLVAVGAGRYDQVLGASNVRPVTIGRDLVLVNGGASYNFNFMKLWFFMGQEKAQANAFGNSKMLSGLLGATVPLGASELRGSIAHYDLQNSPNDFSKLSLGYGYNLSKRTQLYATVAFIKNKGGSTRSVRPTEGLSAPGSARPGGNSNGLDFGVRHAF